MVGAPIAFVAYSSRDTALSQLIGDAVYVANGKSDRVRYETWVYNDIPGNPVISPILDRIEESEFIIADITTLNLNVIYEIAFAIGRRRRAYLIRHQGTTGDKAVAREAGIFDTLGYHEYSDQDDLVKRLTSNIDPEPLQVSVELDHRAPVYLVEPPVKGLAVTTMIARLKKARYRYRSFIPGEDVPLSAVDAIRQVASSSGVLVALEEPSKLHALVHNIRSMFVAGLADGMGKPLLVLRPAPKRRSMYLTRSSTIATKAISPTISPTLCWRLRTTSSRMLRIQSKRGPCFSRCELATRPPRTRWRRWPSTIYRRMNISGRYEGALIWRSAARDRVRPPCSCSFATKSVATSTM
jgi:hypothetical protein